MHGIYVGEFFMEVFVGTGLFTRGLCFERNCVLRSWESEIISGKLSYQPQGQ